MQIQPHRLQLYAAQAKAIQNSDGDRTLSFGGSFLQHRDELLLDKLHV